MYCFAGVSFACIYLLLDLESFIQTHNSYKCVMTSKLDSIRNGLQERITLELDKMCCSVALYVFPLLCMIHLECIVCFFFFSQPTSTAKLLARWEKNSASAERKNERSDRGFIAGLPKPVCRLSFRGARNRFNLPGKNGCHVVQNDSTYEDVILCREITS